MHQYDKRWDEFKYSVTKIKEDLKNPTYSIEEIKRNQWLKLDRPFNDAANLEVYFKGEWHRVTAGDFR